MIRLDHVAAHQSVLQSHGAVSAATSPLRHVWLANPSSTEDSEHRHIAPRLRKSATRSILSKNLALRVLFVKSAR